MKAVDWNRGSMTTPAEGEMGELRHDSEGKLIRQIHGSHDAAGAVINPGALPWIDVYISNAWARESLRRESVPAKASSGARGAGERRTTADAEQ
ncbi:hypothetical protein [Streptomyces sp. MZ04]|uniref:type II 3-dehydroquinate dehydratase n=1 Tax=Streptomyces sp. MZ04 TaxID=2559236 RepID=UPI00107E89BF|nr:hypothetical protein [Streptomyces sp. MZ04]TGB14467.1 hypothetical protein E2651_05795 [Streptomyces sp. MZ04]